MGAVRRLTSAPVRLAAVLALVAGLLAMSAAEAATPTSGKVTPTQKSVSWTGGPFFTPNVSGNALDQPLCVAPTDCDDFKLHVTTPAGYGTSNALNVKVSWSNATADFDVYVLDKAGNVVGSAASSADPEQVVLPPNSGDYTVRVVPFAPLGESYKATATLAPLPTNPPPGTATPPKFKSYAAPGSLADANDAGEPSIGTSAKSGATFFQSGLSTFKVLFNDSVSPATAKWSDVSANASNGCPQGSTFSLDPILWTDHSTGRTFESQLTGQDSFTCYTDNDGKSWSPSTGGGIPSGVDHQTIGGGPFSPSGVGPLPTSTYKHAVYYCSQDIATAFCAVSRDGGTTFGPGVPAYSLLDCGGLHGHVKVAPDGTAYVPNKSCGSGQAVVVSRDNGATWTVHEVPGTTAGDSDPSVGVGANGTVYFGYVGADGRPGVAVSHDHGATWTNRQVVGTKYSIQNAVFPTMVAGDDDRASFAYLGTPTDGNYQDNAKFHGIWHLYVDTTYDGGKTWVTSDATPNDPVQAGSICTSGTTCGDDRNLLDFIDTTIDSHGRVEVAFADGCIKTCVSDPKHVGRDAYATIARQTTGKPLFAAFDPASTNVTLSSLSLSRSGSKVTATAVVRNTGTRSLSNVPVRISDGTKQVGQPTVSSLPAGTKRTVTVTWTASGTRTVTAVADPLNKIRESDEGDNKFQKKIS